MKLFCCALVFAIASYSLMANDIYLSTGYVYRSVTVDTSGTVILIDMGSRIDTIPQSIVLMNTPTAYHNQGQPRLTPMTSDEEEHFNKKNSAPVAKPSFSNPALTPRTESMIAKKRTNRLPNAPLIVASLLGALTAWDKFATARDYTESIDNAMDAYNKLTAAQKRDVPAPDLSRSKSARTRSYVVGIAAVLTSVVVTVYALSPVSVAVSPDRLSVAYNF